MRNESICLLRIRGKNLYCTYTENKRNEINLQTKFCCSYTENMRNESVCKLIIRRINLFIYCECVERTLTYTENIKNAQKVKYLGELETKIGNILGRRLSGAYMGPLGQITENQKFSCKFIFKGFDVPLGLS